VGEGEGEERRVEVGGEVRSGRWNGDEADGSSTGSKNLRIKRSRSEESWSWPGPVQNGMG
jgi:hypothetical protein